MNHSPKRVLIDLMPVLPGGENGGAKWLVFELITHLTRHVPETHFVLLIQPCAQDEIKVLLHDNVSLLVADSSTHQKSFIARALGYLNRRFTFIPARLRALIQRLEYFLSQRLARRLTRSVKPDLLFCPFTAPTYHVAGVPTVCSIYDLQYKTYPMFFEQADVQHRDQVFLAACRQATVLVTISDYSRQRILQHSQTLNPKQVVTALVRVANRICHSQQDTTIFERMGLTPKEYFLYPANYWLHKNHEALLNAFCLATQDPQFPVSMKLVCSGALKERQIWLQRAAERMGLASRVLFTEHLTQAELAALMHQSYAMVFPSLYEGFGIPVTEAMAVDIPVICSNTRSLPEVAGDAALYFDPRIPTDIANVLVKLATDQKEHQRLIQAGQKRVKMFTDTSQMAAEYWQAFLQAYTQENLV